jgi:hypothetical protein
MAALTAILKFLPWQLYAALAALIAIILFGGLEYRHGYKSAEDRYAKATAELRIKAAKQDADHAAQLHEINTAHAATAMDLQSRLDAALHQPASVRIIRVRDNSSPGVPCAAPDAGISQAARADNGQADRDAAAYRVFRDNLLRFAAQDELTRQAALDAVKAW